MTSPWKSALTAILLLISYPLTVQGSPRLADRPEVADAVKVLDIWIAQRMVDRHVPGLAIAVVFDDELVWSKGYGSRDLETKTPVTPSTPFRIGSVTKLFTATAILQLRDRGELELDDPVSQHLPWFEVRSPFPDQGKITIRHLLTHTSGLPREAAFPYWTDHIFPSSKQLSEALPGQRVIHAPGTQYRYSNLGMALLGEVVAAVSGRPWADFVQTEILRPLAMNDSSAAPDDKLLARRATPYMLRQPDGSRGVFDYYDTGAIGPAANMISTVEDLGRFASLHFRDGSAEQNGILRASSLREMHRAHFVYPRWTGGRGLGFGIAYRDGRNFVAHGGWIGGNRTHFLLVPSERIAVIAMINADDGNPYPFSTQAYEVLGPALLEATAVSGEAPEKKIDPTWQNYLGSYADPWGWEYEVIILGNELVLYGHDYPPEEDASSGYSRLIPVEGSSFLTTDEVPVIFELGADGAVSRIRRRYDYLFPKEN